MKKACSTSRESHNVTSARFAGAGEVYKRIPKLNCALLNRLQDVIMITNHASSGNVKTVHEVHFGTTRLQYKILSLLYFKIKYLF